jgi:hypothetical protein
MIEAEEQRMIGSILEDVKILKNRVEEMEMLLQNLVELHHDAAYEVREEYLERLDAIEKNGEFEEFSNIKELKRRIEGEGD